MKVFKKVSSGVPFARKAAYEYSGTKYDADIKNGDTVKILDAGVVESGQYGDQHNFKIKTRNGEKKMALNQKTINVLIEEFGDNTEEWVGKDVQVILKKDVIAGKRVEIAYLVVGGWKLDEYGDLVKEGNEPPAEIYDEEISTKDIPF